MGLRMALGAQPSAVRWLVVRESAWTVIAGVAIGLVGGLRRRSVGPEPAVRRGADRSLALAGATALLLTIAFDRGVPSRPTRVAHRSAGRLATRVNSAQETARGCVLSRLRSLWRKNLVHRDRIERELDAELRTTFEALEEEHRRSGMSGSRGPAHRDAAARARPVTQRTSARRQGRRVRRELGPGRALCPEAPAPRSALRRLCHRVAGAWHRRHRRHLLPVRRHRAAPAQCTRARPAGRRVVGKARRPVQSERLARHFEGNPIGQRLGSGAGASEVVGVARDTRYANVKDAPREVVYYPIFQIAPGRTSSTPQRSRSATPAAERDWSRRFGRSPPAWIRV